MDSEQRGWCSIWRSALPVLVGAILGTVVGIVLGMLIASKVPEGLAFASQVICVVVWPLLVLVLFGMFRDEVRRLLNRLVIVKTKWGTLMFRCMLKAERLAKEVAVGPPSVPLLSAKQRIRDQWQRIQDKLAEVYRQSASKPPPRAYRPLATRLKEGKILTDGKVWELIDTVRNIYRQTKKASEFQVTADLADYYESLVRRVLDGIARATK